ANLLLARGASRRREIAVRTALGASRARLVQQLLTESVLLSLVGGAAGLALAWIGIDLLLASAPDSVPRLHEITIDPRVVVFTALVSVVTGLVFGVAPALRAARAEPNDTLKEGGRAESSPLGRSGRVLVVAEVALSLVLLAAAGLLLHSFARLQRVEPGFDAARLLTFRVSLPQSRYTTFERGNAFFEQLFGNARSSPAIASIAAVNALPFSGVGGSRSFYIEGREVKRAEDQPEDQLRIVSHDYFATMRIPIVTGREFTARDTLAAPRVAVVNDALARKYFPDGR